MASLHEMALPGSVPTFSTRGGALDTTTLFKSRAEKAEYQRLVNGTGSAPEFAVKKVCVKIFDLSDKKQVSEYEKLWKKLLEKSAKMEVVVDSRQDLVHRADGTSYWMKYVEYVEFGDANEGSDPSEGSKGK